MLNPVGLYRLSRLSRCSQTKAQIISDFRLSNEREISVRYLFCKAPFGPLRGKRYRTLISRTILSNVEDLQWGYMGFARLHVLSQQPLDRWRQPVSRRRFARSLAPQRRCHAGRSYAPVLPIGRRFLAAKSAPSATCQGSIDDGPAVRRALR